MFGFRSIFSTILILLLISLSGAVVFADSAPRFCMVLVTATNGGVVQPEGAISVPYGSGFNLTFTPLSGYEIQKIFVDGTDTGQYSALSLSPVTHDMTVHAVFAPEGRSPDIRSSTPGSSSVGPALGTYVSLTANYTSDSLGSGRTQGKVITVGQSGADFWRIQDAITNASPGDTINVESGTYNETVSIQKSVTLVGLPGDSGRPVISAEGNGTIISIIADDVQIKNLSITSFGRRSGLVAIGGEGISDLALENCVISSTGIGIMVNRSTDISIRDCTLRNISETGLLFSSVNRSVISGNSIDQCETGFFGSRLERLTFWDNLISSSGHDGTLFRDGIVDSDISDNIYVGNGQETMITGVDREGGALSLEYADNVTVSGNDLERNQGTALILNDCVRMMVKGNTLLDNYAGFTYSGDDLDPGNTIDPTNTVNGLPVIYHERVDDTIIDGISLATLYLRNCTNMTISNLSIHTRNGFGIQVIGGSDISMLNCSVRDNLYQNILIADLMRGKITGSEISDGSQHGIGLINVADFKISGCQIRNNSIGAAVRGSTSWIDMGWNTFNSNAIGFLAENNNGLAGFGTLSGNLFECGRIGISIAESIGGNITGNEITGVLDGIVLAGSDGVFIEDNHVTALDTGIRMAGLRQDGSSNHDRECTGNTVIRNTFSAGKSPLLINETQVTGNSLFLNDFVTTMVVSSADIPRQQDVSGSFSWGGVRPSPEDVTNDQKSQSSGETNAWDTGERLRYSYNGTTFSGYLGNHWSNYTGSEIAASGVGDLPVQITPGNIDQYPLTASLNQYHIQGSGYYLELKSGWNFISTPSVLKAGSDSARIFEDVDTKGHSLYTWQNATWKPVKREQAILPLNGYWIYSANNAAVPFSFDPGIVPAPVHLFAGWNAIGHPGIQQAAARDAFSSLGDSWKYCAGFNASVQAYEEPIMREEGGNAILYPSHGYWVYMDHEWDLQPVTG